MEVGAQAHPHDTRLLRVKVPGRMPGPDVGWAQATHGERTRGSKACRTTCTADHHEEHYGIHGSVLDCSPAGRVGAPGMPKRLHVADHKPRRFGMTSAN